MPRDAGQPRIKPLKWTVPGYFYAKSVALLAGKRGGGKSLFVAWFAGMASRGLFIDERGHEQTREPMNTWINVIGEDPIEEFWLPRLKLANADMGHVRVTGKNYLFPGSLGSLRDDLYELRSTGFPVDLLIFESMSTHVKNPYYGFEKNRQAMSGLVTIAEIFDLTVILAHHFRKGKGHTVESSIGGQGVIQNASKAIFVVSPYPKADSVNRVLACERINGKEPASLQFELLTKKVPEAKAAHPFLRYVGPIDVTARDVYNASREESKGTGATGVEVAAEFIRQHWIAKAVPVMRVVDLEDAAKAAEVWFSKGTFLRAKELAGVQNVRDARARELLGAEYDFANADGDGRTAWVKLPKQVVGEEVLPKDKVGRTLADEAEVYLRHQEKDR